jgi:hypothetical protein
MNSTLAKIILGNIFRSLLTAVITFLVTKNVIEADVATKLARGDTVQLWHGTVGLNMTMIINVLVGLAVPIVLPIGLGIWSRMQSAYELIVARSNEFASSKKQLKDQVSQASVTEIIKTVATEQPPQP